MQNAMTILGLIEPKDFDALLAVYFLQYID